MQSAYRDAQAQLLQTFLEEARGVRQILQQLGFGAELDQKRLVFFA